jgi:menaquinone-9 beta-reductase
MEERMADCFDVVIVGARCAGAPLAASLAQRGLRVCVVDRARFPSEVPSTHLIHPCGVARLARLGLFERLLATGAPPLVRGRFLLDDVELTFDASLAGHFEAPWLCIRRSVLDPLLIEAAREAGAQVRTATAVTGLVHEEGAVAGVQTPTGEIHAPLVVGADGPNSAVARLVGAREYHVTPPGRLFLWGYFEGADAPDGYGALGRIGDLGFLAMWTDAGLFMAGVALAMADREAALADVERSFTKGVFSLEPVGALLGSARRIGPVRTMTRWRGYFREAMGPGWVLVGDAGHFKDPTPAQGIADALRQGDRLRSAIEDGLGGGDLTGQLEAFWRWRDDDAREMYWFATDMGSSGLNPGIATEMFRSLSRDKAGSKQLLRVLNHDLTPSKVFTAALGLRTLGRIAVTRPTTLPRMASEAREVSGRDARRRHLPYGPIALEAGGFEDVLSRGATS